MWTKATSRSPSAKKNKKSGVSKKGTPLVVYLLKYSSDTGKSKKVSG